MSRFYIYKRNKNLFKSIYICDSIIANNKSLSYSFFDLIEYESPKQHITHFLFLECLHLMDQIDMDN